jgi:hypothetical protein
MKHPPHRPVSVIQRCASAFWAATFLFFLLFSAPHQVHHFFDQSPKAHHHETDHEHSNSGENNRNSADSNCVFQVSASRCQLGLAWLVAPASLPILVRPVTLFTPADSGFGHLPTPFQIRAPPLA